MFAIVNGSGSNPLYLTGITRGRCARWDTDGLGRMIRKVERKPIQDTGKEKGVQTVSHYVPDIGKARKFRSMEAAQKMIAENPVLRFCRVEEVNR